jgi:hypothetical protein
MASLHVCSTEITDFFVCTPDGHDFGFLKASEVSDSRLVRQIQHERYMLLTKNVKPIFCTAIDPVHAEMREINPHDEREGTIHFAAIERKTDRLVASIRVAVDLQQKWQGKSIGLPLENVYGETRYPEGASLDPFRDRYMKCQYNEERRLGPWEMCELYRQFCLVGDSSPRMGMYFAIYYILVYQMIKHGLTPCWIWSYDAISLFHNLYRKASLSNAYLRDMSISDNPEMIVASIRDLITVKHNGTEKVSYKGKIVSRDVPVDVPKLINGAVVFTRETIPFIDGMVDIRQYDKTTAVMGGSLAYFENSGFRFLA